MPRKNRVAGRRPQARRRADGLPSAPRPIPIAISDTVTPQGRCFFKSRKGKLIFATEAIAQKALAQARRKRLAAAGGSQSTLTTKIEKRVYPCPDGGCGGWHLSSWVEYQERTA